MKSITTFSLFRKIGIAEGISFLVLLLIAMPLKYFAGFPMAVTIVGSLHGVLFVAYMALALEVENVLIVKGRFKRLRWLIICFIAAILPFGTFVLDNRVGKKLVD